MPLSRNLLKTARLLQRLRVAALLALALVASKSIAATIILNPVADADIRQLDPTTPHGDEPSVTSGQLGQNAGFEIRRVLMRFDLSQIPAGAVVNSATLRVTVVRNPISPVNSIFEIRRVLQLWTETGVSWNFRTSSQTPWQVAGATGSSDTVGTASSSVFVRSTDFAEYTFSSTAALVSDLQTWVNNGSVNFGWLLVSEDEVSHFTARRFGSREDPTHQPVLTINYSQASLAVSIQPPSQDVPEGSTNVTFTASVTGAPPFTYQWFFNANPINGETNSSLVLNNVQTNQTGSYTVMVSNQAGSATSAPATLNVLPIIPGQPVVTITSPTNGAKFPSGANVLIAAAASVSNGVIAQVEFLLFGTNSIGVATTSPFQIFLPNAAPGNYFLTARATDTKGGAGSSPSVAFSVIEPPAVLLNVDSRYPIGSNIAVTANVTTKGANISEVAFFAAAGGLEATNIGSFPGDSSKQTYTTNWLPAGPGDFILTATALDELGQTGQSIVLVRIYVPELILPAISLTDGPKNFARVTESPITLSGTASDNIGLEKVEFSVVSGPLLQNIGDFVPAEGTGNWIAQVPLQPGKNAVRIRSVDLAGNESAVITRFYTYLVRAPLTLIHVGEGFVTPNLDGRDLELGKVYTVSAHPGPNQIFSQWEIRTNTDLTLTNNVLFTNRATLSFQMRSNLVLVADFEANNFPPFAGTYAGLFFDADTNRFRPENAGSFTLQLGNRGNFSGRAVVEGVGYPVRGKFDLDGKAKVGIFRRAQPPISISLNLDMTGNTGSVTGIVTTASDANVLTSTLLAFVRANPSPITGRQSFSLVDAFGDEVVAAEGSISSTGNVDFQGAFSSRRFNFTTSIGDDGSVPFYVALNRGRDIIAGWINFSNETGATGELYWVSPSFSGVSLLTAVAQ